MYDYGVRCYSEWLASVECQYVFHRGSPLGNKVATALGFCLRRVENLKKEKYTDGN
jgi:hypothetical protein